MHAVVLDIKEANRGIVKVFIITHTWNTDVLRNTLNLIWHTVIFSVSHRIFPCTINLKNQFPKKLQKFSSVFISLETISTNKQHLSSSAPDPEKSPQAEMITSLASIDPWWALPLLLILLVLPLKNLLLSPARPKSPPLPPGPPSIPILSTCYWISKNLLDIEPIVRSLRTKYGPILTLRITSQPTIFISDRSLAHRALVHHGAALSDRLPPSKINRVLASDRHGVTTAPYGPLWRVLRRNLASEILHPAKVKQFVDARNWVLDILIEKLNQESRSGNGIVVMMEGFRFAMFCLLVLMCFGEKLDVNKIREIENAQNRMQRLFSKLGVFSVFPKITKVVFRRRWKEMLDTRRGLEEIFTPLIRARGGGASSYVDSLLELSIPDDGGRRLTEGEIVSLCSEFLAAGTDTTATALEWTMAELVKNPEIQDRLAKEIENVAEANEKVKEEDLQMMPYLKAVVLEGLRRHPPGHFVLPHVATEDIEVGGYVVPKDASVNVMVADLGMDEKIWSDPMEFRPERFLAGGEAEDVDLTGSREILMMPFGVGRRICPGLGLAMLHLEYFVANLVREFEWKAVEGEEVDLSETLELTVVMKNPLRARIFPRRRKTEINCST